MVQLFSYFSDYIQTFLKHTMKKIRIQSLKHFLHVLINYLNGLNVECHILWLNFLRLINCTKIRSLLFRTRGPFEKPTAGAIFTDQLYSKLSVDQLLQWVHACCTVRLIHHSKLRTFARVNPNLENRGTFVLNCWSLHRKKWHAFRLVIWVRHKIIYDY